MLRRYLRLRGKALDVQHEHLGQFGERQPLGGVHLGLAPLAPVLIVALEALARAKVVQTLRGRVRGRGDRVNGKMVGAGGQWRGKKVLRKER
jgi:hypothetical protein